jgi:hypothetical protein
MNADILSIDPIIIEEIPKELTTLLINQAETIPLEVPLPLPSRFGIVDLWKIRSARRHFTFYR